MRTRLTMIDRRRFIKSSLAFTGATMSGSVTRAGTLSDLPSYLKGYERAHDEDPRKAALAWFRDAKFGLFLHYGLYSLLGRGEWVQYNEKMPVLEYAKLMEQFTAKAFDADFITDQALEAEMKYVNITTMHHDGFCLFDTQETDFNSINSPAKRDLVGELAEQCQKKGLGMCFYYSHGRHWRHPHAMTNEKYGRFAQPEYAKRDPSYADDADHDIAKYVAYCEAQVTELLTHYGPVANIWFDGYATPEAGPWQDELRIPELYETVRKLQPACLISYKWGLTGTEDFFSPEYHWLKKNPDRAREAAASGKPMEICTSFAGWGYQKKHDGKHPWGKAIMKKLEHARANNANLLLNTGPLPDGSIDKHDVYTLRAVGRRIRNGE